MCGILCLLTASPAQVEWNQTVYEHVKRRGPNCSRDLSVARPDLGCRCRFSAHVLHMRGVLTPQPVRDGAGNVLLWNGEVFGGVTVTPEQNDTALVSRRLASCGGAAEVLRFLASVRGPWALVYYQRDGPYLWFGRDFFGRRSLLWKFEVESGTLSLSSVAAQTSAPDPLVWTEVPALGLYRLDLKAAAEGVTFELFPWATEGCDVTSTCGSTHVPRGCSAVLNRSGLSLPSPVSMLNTSTPDSINETDVQPNPRPPVAHLDHILASTQNIAEVESLIALLSEAVRRRVQARPFHGQDPSPDAGPSPDADQAAVAVLFSGGIDSMVVAALADRHIPSHQPIDLLNVAFKRPEPKAEKDGVKKSKNKVPGARTPGPFDVPDRVTGRAGLEELRALSPDRRWNFVEINVRLEELQTMRRRRICHAVYPLDTVLDDSIGCAVWFAARGAGVVGEEEPKRPFTSTAKVSELRRPGVKK